MFPRRLFEEETRNCDFGVESTDETIEYLNRSASTTMQGFFYSTQYLYLLHRTCLYEVVLVCRASTRRFTLFMVALNRDFWDMCLRAAVTAEQMLL